MAYLSSTADRIEIKTQSECGEEKPIHANVQPFMTLH